VKDAYSIVKARNVFTLKNMLIPQDVVIIMLCMLLCLSYANMKVNYDFLGLIDNLIFIILHNFQAS